MVWRKTYFLFLLILIALLAGCSKSPKRSYPVPSNNTPFNPPTAVPTPTPTPIPPTPANRPTQKQNCTNVLLYIRDTTIPDKTEVKPGSTMDKRWEVKNSGTCNWDDTYTLQLIKGPEMGSPIKQALYPARSGTQFEIRVVLTAPMEANNYHSAWQAYDPNGQPFGDPVYIDITVTK